MKESPKLVAYLGFPAGIGQTGLKMASIFYSLSSLITKSLF